ETEAPQEDLEEGVAPSTNYRITDEKLIELCEVHIEHYENQGNAANSTECGRFQAIWRLGRDWLKRLHVEGESRVLTHASLRIHSTQFAQEVCDAWQCGIFDEYFLTQEECDPPEELEDATLSLNYQITAEKLIKLCKIR